MSTAAAAAADAPPPAKGKKKLIIIIVAAVLLLGGAGGGALLLLKKPPADEDGEESAHVEKAPSKAKAAAPRHDPKHPPVFAPLDPFTVNLADRETERYAQIALTLELDEAATADIVKNFMPAIRNNILMVLAHKTSTEILAAEGKTRLAGEIQRATARAIGVEVEEPEADAEADDEEAPKPKKKSKKGRKKAEDVVLPIRAVHFSNFIVQ